MALNSIDIFEDEQIGGVITGFPKLDQTLGFLQPGIVLLKGKSGSGKTSFSLQAGLQSTASCLFITAEQSEKALIKRLIARMARISLSAITNKAVAKEDLEAGLRHVTENTPFLHFEEALHGAPSLAYIKNLIHEVRERDGSPNTLVCIDSIDDFLIQSKNNYEGFSTAELAKKLALMLNDLAKDEKVTFLLTLQQKVDKTVEDIFTYAAETVLEIAFDKEGRENAAGIKKSKISVTKNRAGALKTLFLDFEGEFQNFS